MARLEVLVAVALCLGLSSPAAGSTITEKFNADDIISFLHDLPRYDLSLSQASNVFDPGSWSYDQTMIWFVAPGVLVLLLTMGLAAILAIRRCVLGCLREAAANEGEETDGGFDSFPVLPVISQGMVLFQGPTLPRWVRTVHVLTFILMVIVIGVVIVTWLASFDFFNFIHNSYQPVDKANELLNTGFGYVNTSLSVSLAGLREVAQLNATFESIRADVLTLRNSVGPLATALNRLPNITAFRAELSAWPTRQVVDLPTALPPIYADLAALNASFASMPVSTTNALARLKSTVDLSQFVVAQQYFQLVVFAGQLYAPLLSATRALHYELEAMEERTRKDLLPVEASLVKAVLAGGADPPLPDDITALARLIQENYVQKGDAINALSSVRQLVQALLRYSGRLPDALSRDMNKMRADYDASLQTTLDMDSLLTFLETVGPLDPVALAAFVKQQVPPALDRVLTQYLETPPGLQAAYTNWDQQTHDLSGQMNSYHKIQDQINEYLPKIESVIDKVELSRFILFNLECAWMVLACLLSLLAICRPRLQTWLMAMLFLALVLAGVEMVVYLPPAVFTADFCIAPDNYTLSQVDSASTDPNVATYARYYIYCGTNETIESNSSSINTNPLLPYTSEVRDALMKVEPLLATLNNISAVAIGTRPIVRLLSEQQHLTLQEIGKLEQLSNCSTVHPLYVQMKTNVCDDLTPAVFLLFVDRGVLVGLMVLVVLGSIATLSHHDPLHDGNRGYTMLSGRPRRKAMTEAYLGGVPLVRDQVGMSTMSINAVDNVNVNVQRP